MESKELKEEIKESFAIYKIAGAVIVLLLLIGIIFAVFTREKAPVVQTAPTPVEPVLNETPAENITAPAENITQNITANITQNATQIQNITPNVTPNATPSIPVPENKTEPFKQVNYTWESIKINFPESMKKVSSTANNYEYIEILEADNTPITNGEQFDLSFIVDNPYGEDSDLVSNFESGKWLITLLIPNDGNYTLTVTVKCEEQKGHCQRFYDEKGSAQKTIEFEVV